MKLTKNIVVAFILLFQGWGVVAQQDAQFSHYMFTKLYYNPAYSGMDPYSSASLLHRSQWLAYQTINNNDQGGAPVTQQFSFNHGLKYGGNSNKAGVGLILVNDVLGPLHNLNLKLSYAHHVDLSSGKLSMGLKGGFYSQRIRVDWLRANDEANDPIISQLNANGSASQLKPDFGLGFWYQDRLDKYYLGVSMNHLIRSSFDWGVDEDSINTKLIQHLYITGGYNIQISNNISLLPNFIIQSDIDETNWKMGVLATYDTKVKNEYWLGLTFRQSFTDKGADNSGKKYSLDDLVIIAGLGTMKNKDGNWNSLKLSYAFDLVSSGVKAKNPTSHEIMLTYILPSGLTSGRPPLKTPRYEHPK